MLAAQQELDTSVTVVYSSASQGLDNTTIIGEGVYCSLLINPSHASLLRLRRLHMHFCLDLSDALLMSYALAPNSSIDVFLLQMLRQCAKRTLAEQEINLLQRLLVRFLEEEIDRRNSDENVPCNEDLKTTSQHSPGTIRTEEHSQSSISMKWLPKRSATLGQKR